MLLTELSIICLKCMEAVADQYINMSGAQKKSNLYGQGHLRIESHAW